MAHRAEWPPLYWQALAFLGGLCLMLNHFHDQGLRYGRSEALLKWVAIYVSPVLLATAGLLAMIHVLGAPSDRAPGVLRLLVSSAVWCVVAFVPLIALEDTLFPIGRGISEGMRLAVPHLPFVAVFLAGLWNAGRLYRRRWRTLRALVSPTPAGFLYGMALVYSGVFGKRLGYHWHRCRDAESLTQFLTCFF